MGRTVHWSCLLVMKSEVALCTDDRQRGKKRFCLLCSTNRCSISDGMVHILLPDVDALYSCFEFDIKIFWTPSKFKIFI